MGTRAVLVSVLTLLATPVAAQSSTEEGIRAMLRGEYQDAARILRLLADDPARPDPVAQFFLAILYDTGHAGGTHSRACPLFERAAALANPLSGQSSALAAALREELGPSAGLFCVADERWQGGTAQRFILGPGHQIVFADTAIRVTHDDQEHTVLYRPPLGAAFLPIQYTPLAVTRPIAARRHFFQWFAWMPDSSAKPSSWRLAWVLSEVVGDRWIPITSQQSLAVVNGPIPPRSFEVATLVSLRVNATGDVELTIADGGSPRTEVIAWQGKR